LAGAPAFAAEPLIGRGFFGWAAVGVGGRRTERKMRNTSPWVFIPESILSKQTGGSEPLS